MDSKYGNLYTEDDVRTLFAVVMGEEKAHEVMNDLVHSQHSPVNFKFPHDEPLFLLRAQDINARGALEEYEVLCDENGSPEEHVEGIRKARADFQTFRDEHSDRIKRPD